MPRDPFQISDTAGIEGVADPRPMVVELGNELPQRRLRRHEAGQHDAPTPQQQACRRGGMSAQVVAIAGGLLPEGRQPMLRGDAGMQMHQQR